MAQSEWDRGLPAIGCPNINPLHGITSTPVIDRTAGVLYACGLVLQNGRQAYEVFAVDLATGRLKDGWPVTIEGNDRGLTFDAAQLTQRGALTLLDLGCGRRRRQ